MIDSRLLVFYKAAEKGSFSAAAEELFLTQPAVTFQIRKLEEHYGTPLFYREKNRVTLTEAGALLFQHAGKILASYEKADQALSRLSGRLRGRLRIGASTTMGEYILPRVLGDFAARHTAVEPILEIGNSDRILNGVTSRFLDLGILAEKVEHRELRQEKILDDELLLITPPGHPLSRKGSAPISALARYPMIAREPGSGTRKEAEAQLRKAGLDPRKLHYVMRLGSSEAVKAAVEADLGIAILSGWVIRKELRLGTLRGVRIRGVRIRRDFKLIHYRKKRFPLHLQAFVDFLHEYDWGSPA